MKLKFFSRVTAVALTLAMLLPCVLTAPVAAAGETDPAVTNIWHFGNPKLETASRNKFMNVDFKTNLVFDYSTNTANYNYPVQYARFSNLYTPDGPIKMTGFTLGGTHWPSISTGSMDSYDKFNGVPYRFEESGAVKMMEQLKMDLTGVEYPIVTRGMGALNLSFTYGNGGGIMDIITADELQVRVSLDGESWLKDTVGIRSWKLVGGGQRDAGNRGKANRLVFHVETEDLFEIDGLEPGARIVNLQIQFLDDDTSQGIAFDLLEMDVNSYATKADFERLVPRREKKFVHVGEDTMRQIVIEEGARFADIAWTTDTVIHTITGANNMLHFPGVQYRGAVYTQDGDSSREWLEANIKDGKWIGGYGQDNAAGTDCQNFVFNAVCRVSPAMGWACQYTMGAPGLTLLGEDFLNIPESIISYTDTNLVNHNTQQDMFKAYALAKKGDQMVNYDTKKGGHVRVVSDNKVVYKEDGTIDGAKSTMMSTQQAMYPYYNVQLADGTIERVSAAGNNAYVTKVLPYLEKHPGSKVLYGHASMRGTLPDSEPHSYDSLYNSTYAFYTNDYYATGNIMLEDVDILIMSKAGDKPLEQAGTAIAFASNYCYIGYDVLLEDLSTGEKLFDYKYIYNGSNDASRGLYQNADLDAKMQGLTNGSYRLSFSLHSGPFTALGQSKVPVTTQTYDFTVTDKAPAAQVTLNAPASATKGQTVEVQVNSAAALNSADIDVKFDTEALSFVSAQTADGLFAKNSNGIVNLMAVGMDVSAGAALTKLTFTAKKDIAKLSDVVAVKSAHISTADAANTADAAKATDGTQVNPIANFGDVHENAWYHEAVGYAVSNGVMSGYNAATFGPNDKLSRAMVVQVLYNYEGQPAEATENKFPDVKAADWYFNATRWGANKGVVSGYGNGHFGPNDNVTVEQIAVILHNYAGKPAGSGDLASVGKYDDWAAGALQWAVANGVLKNVPFTNATETATRAQTAQMLMNYLNK